MRSMMLRNDPFRSLFEELLQPYKGMQNFLQVHSPEHVLEAGTVDKPAIITRGEWVERKYKAWQEEDGSYHEELIVNGEDLPTKKEGTG